MRLFQLLQLLDDELVPVRCKLHLANWNGSEDPLDEYLAGRFDAWQCWQTKKNFERDFVVALIALSQPAKWLFAGAYDAGQCRFVSEHELYQYEMSKRSGAEELAGRLIVSFQRTGRQSYLRAENWAEELLVAELRSQRLTVAEFPGYSSAMISKQHLDIVVQQQEPSWKAALASVSGVYLIADRRTGKLYVGSATGEGGIWARWCEYSATGHGGNRELARLLKDEGADYATHFQFGVLEIADSHASAENVLKRETWWKNLLLTREFGHNAN